MLRNRNTRGKHLHLPRGCFRLASNGEGRAPTLIEVWRVSSGSDKTNSLMKRGGVVRRADSEGTRRSELGRVLPLPKREPPRAPDRGRECEDKAAQTNLGARSHSGNSPEADAEGWIAFASGRQPSGENSPETAKWIWAERLISSHVSRWAYASARPRALLHAFTPRNPEGKREMRGQGSGRRPRRASPRVLRAGERVRLMLENVRTWSYNVGQLEIGSDSK